MLFSYRCIIGMKSLRARKDKVIEADRGDRRVGTGFNFQEIIIMRNNF